MATIAKTSRPTAQARDANIIAGITKRLKTTPAIVLLGVSYTPATLSALFQSGIDSANQVTAAHGQWITATQSDKVLRATVNAVTTGLQDFVRQMFNSDPAALADFGFTAKKKTTPTVAEKVVAVARRAVTRTARHTTGPVKRLETVGTLTGPVVIPAGPPAAPPPAPAAGIVAPGTVNGASLAAETNGHSPAPKPPTAG